MTDGLLRVKSLEPKSGYHLEVRLEDDQVLDIDFSEAIREGGVFADLGRNDNFSKVRIGDRQRVIEWPVPKDINGYPIIEIDAESLLAMWRQQQDVASLERRRRTVA